MQLCIFLITVGVAVVTLAIQDVARDRRSSRAWPLGTYGLPMPKSGCPKGYFWYHGTRFHDTEDDDPKNYWSNPYNLAGKIGRNDMEQKFCMKTQYRTNSNSRTWPRGEYCIYKKGICPRGFNKGYIFWDDEDDNNRNRYSGTLPDGLYNRDTKIDFCCRTDGHATNPIYLPTDSPFVLFKCGSHQCQRVHGMRVDYHYFYWDNEDDDQRKESKWPHPTFDYWSNDIRLYYCYYYK